MQVNKKTAEFSAVFFGQNGHNATFILKQRGRMASRAFIYGGDRKFVELCGANFRQEGDNPPMKKVLQKNKALTVSVKTFWSG